MLEYTHWHLDDPLKIYGLRPIKLKAIRTNTDNVCVHLFNASDTLTSTLHDVVKSRCPTMNLDKTAGLVWLHDKDHSLRMGLVCQLLLYVHMLDNTRPT